MTAVKATFSDFRLVRSRKVAQLVMEVPIEAADHALKTLGGLPKPDLDLWVGIARITEEAATRAPEKPRQRFSEMPRVKQAGILCGTPQFAAFCAKVHGVKTSDPEYIAAFVRGLCNVASRSDLDDSTEAAKAWDALVTEYDAWRGKIGRPG